jgi:hypothetical protein
VRGAPAPAPPAPSTQPAPSRPFGPFGPLGLAQPAARSTARSPRRGHPTPRRAPPAMRVGGRAVWRLAASLRLLRPGGKARSSPRPGRRQGSRSSPHNSATGRRCSPSPTRR